MKSTPNDRAEYIVIPDQENQENTILYPDDILSYGFEDNRSKYFSAKVIIDGEACSVFLEELIRDEDLTVYVLNSKKGEYYFMQNGSQQPRLVTDKEELRSCFQQKATGCSKINSINSRPMKLKRSSITKMYEAYTNCNVNVFSRFRFGITAGIYLASFKIGHNRDFDYDNSVSFSPGLYVEIPLDLRFSFRPELVYKSIHAKGKPDQIKYKNTEMDYKRQSFMFPLLIRYRISQSTNAWIPYIELGPTFDIKLSGSNYNKQSKVKNEVSSWQYGGALGFGIERKLTDFISLYGGLRYNASAGISTGDEKEFFNLYSFSLTIGF